MTNELTQADINGDTTLMKLADVGDLKGTIAHLQELAKVTASDAEYKDYVNHTNTYGNTALMLAANHNHYVITDTLLKAGAIATLTNVGGKTAADMANNQGFDYIVDLLVEEGGVERPKSIVELDKPIEIVDTSDTVTTEEIKSDGS